MCRYRYHYYATCRHHELVLFDFCDKAHSVDAATKDAQHRASNNAYAAEGTTAEAREGSSFDVNSDDLPSIFSADSTFESQSSYPSEEQGSVSITAEPNYDCTSIPSTDLSHSSPLTRSASHDMAGLPLFGNTFRSWMGGPTATSPKQTNVDSYGPVFVSSKRSAEAVSFRST